MNYLIVFLRVLLVLNVGIFDVVILIFVLVCGLWFLWVVCLWILKLLKLINCIFLFLVR